MASPISKIVLLFLLWPSVAFAFCDKNDNTLISCWEAQEGQGLTVRDGSQSGIDGVLTGGPAWTFGTPIKTQQANDPVVISTYTIMEPKAIAYSGVSGVDLRSGITSTIYNALTRMAVAVTVHVAGVQASEAAVFAFGTGASGSWMLSINGPTGGACNRQGVINFQFTAVQNNCFDGLNPAGTNDGNGLTAAIGDSVNPHRIMIMKDGNAGGFIYCYVDGVRRGRKLPSAAMNSVGAGTLGVAFLPGGTGLTAVLNGKAAYSKVWNDFPTESSRRDAFAFNDYQEFSMGKIRLGMIPVQFQRLELPLMRAM